MARNLAALVAGLVFGIGLAVSRMVDPGKVLAFLDGQTQLLTERLILAAQSIQFNLQ